MFFLLCSAAAALNAQEKDIRILFFSDNYTASSALQNSFEQRLGLRGKQYDLDKVEKLPAFFSGQSYIFSLDESKERNLSGKPSNFIYKTTGAKDVIATESAILFQQPYLDKEIRTMAAAGLAEKEDPLSPRLARVRSGILILPDKRELEVLTKDHLPRIQKKLWLPAVMVKYTLDKDGEKSSVYILQKPLGGIGAWFNPVQNINSTENKPLLIINTGGLEKYERLSSQPAFLARYWQTMRTDAVAFAPKDSYIIYNGALRYPELKNILVSTNIESIDSSAPAPFSKSALIEKNGVRIGLLSLSEPGALDGAPGRGLPLKVVSPFKAAEESILELKEKQKADFIILVSHLRKRTLNALLEQTKGIDMIIDAARDGGRSFAKRKTELKDWNIRPAGEPAFTAYVRPDILGDINIKFTLNGKGYSPTVIEDNPPLNIFSDNSFNNEFYPVNKYFFDDSEAMGSDYLLPSAKELSAYGGKKGLSYTPAEIFNMAAAIIRKTAKTELAFIRIVPFKEKLLGALTQKDLESLLDSDEPVVKVKIKGKYLKNILKSADFEDPFSNTKDYNTGFALAVSGVSKKDGSYYINTLPINDDEIYSAAFPVSLLKDSLALPDLAGNIIQTKETGESAQDMVNRYIRTLQEKNKEYALKQTEDYLRRRETRLLNDIPPQDETTEELDLKTSLQGPIAAREYFDEMSSLNYERDLVALIQNKPETYGAWRYNLRNLSLLFSNTDVKNAEKYQDFSDSRLNADGQTLIQGALDFAAEYYKERIRWDNIISLKYGQTTLRPYDEEKTTSENADTISLVSEYTYKSTDIKNFLGGFLIGPFASLGYQTEFTSPDDTPRYKAFRGRAGIRLFEGKYIKDFSLSLSPELDFTYPQTATKYAWQAAIRLEHPLNDNSKAVYAASIRDFFMVKNPSKTDISYEFDLSAKVEMEIMKSFYIAPFINYYQAQASDFSGAGSNLYIGVSLSYSKLFKHLKL